MRLISAKITGYRRLADGCEIKLNTDPVCVVGPNAAGKSSLLDALEHLNDEAEFQVKDRTRVPQGAPLEPVVEARFELAEDDKARLADVPEAAKVSQLIVRKVSNGELSHHPHPEPKRDLGRREGVHSVLQELQNSKWLKDVEQVEPQLDPAPERQVQDLLHVALEMTENSKPNLGDGVEVLVAFRERLREIDAERHREETEKAVSESDPDAQDEGEDVWPGWPPLPKKYERLLTSLHEPGQEGGLSGGLERTA